MRPRHAFAGLAIALGACGSPSAPATTPAEHHVETVTVRPTPPPVITWANGTFAVQGIPAIAAAGEVVVVAIVEPEHEDANLRIEIRGADDRVLEAQTILTRADAGTLVHDGQPSPVLASRIAAMNSELATLHGVHDLRPMHPLAVEPGHDGEDQHWATGDNLDVEWREHHLHVFRHNVSQPVAERDGAPWAAATSAACSGRNPAFLGAVYHVAPGTTLPAAANTIVVEIAYHGDDTCEEPGNRPHVISWVGER